MTVDNINGNNTGSSSEPEKERKKFIRKCGLGDNQSWKFHLTDQRRISHIRICNAQYPITK